MIIGIEASLAFTNKKAGPENYYFQIIKHLLEIDNHNFYRLYVKRGAVDNLGVTKKNYQLIEIDWPRLWTQGGLALECLLNPPDVLFVPAHTMPILRRPNLKTVVTIHDLGAEFLANFHKFPHKYYLNFSTEYAAAHASRLIAISEATRKDLVAKLKANPKKITVIYEGYKTEYHPQASSAIKKCLNKYEIGSDYFLFIGTVQPRKNLERLIEAYSKFLTTSKTSPQLIIAGNPGWLSEPIYQAPKKYGIEKGVKFLGYVPDQDLPALYSGALAFVYPSLFEGFGLPILEAFTIGCPVITSNISSMPEVAGDAAILVDPYSAEEIAQAMGKIVRDKKLRDELVKKGRVQLKKFSWQKAAKETLAVLEEVKNV